MRPRAIHLLRSIGWKKGVERKTGGALLHLCPFRRGSKKVQPVDLRFRTSAAVPSRTLRKTAP